jgi:hypothetical protein
LWWSSNSKIDYRKWLRPFPFHLAFYFISPGIKQIYMHNFGSLIRYDTKVLRRLNDTKLWPLKKVPYVGHYSPIYRKDEPPSYKIQSCPSKFYYTHCLQMTLGQQCLFSFLGYASLGLRCVESSPLVCIRSSSTLSKLLTSALIFATCAHRWSFFICCFDWRSASSANRSVPETHLFVPKSRLNEDLQYNRPQQ